MSSRIWSTDCTTWSAACWPWGECAAVSASVIEIRPGPDATTLIQPWLEEPWNPYRAGEIEREKKRKLLIELVCKVGGQKFSEEKKRKNFKVTVDEIKMLINSGAKIDLDFNLE